MKKGKTSGRYTATTRRCWGWCACRKAGWERRWCWGLLGDFGTTFTILALVLIMDINTAWLLAGVVWHITGMGIRARSVHADNIIASVISTPKLGSTHKCQEARAKGARSWLRAEHAEASGMEGDLGAWIRAAMHQGPSGLEWFGQIVIGIGLAAGIATVVVGLIPPVGRWLAPKPPANGFRNYVTLDRVRDDGTIETSDGWLAQVWRLEGRDHFGLGDRERDGLYEARKHALDQVAQNAKGDLQLRLVTVRERMGEGEAGEQAQGTSKALAGITQRWNAAQSGRTYRNHCYVAGYAREGEEGEASLKACGESLKANLDGYRLEALDGEGMEGPLQLFGHYLSPCTRPAPAAKGSDQVADLVTVNGIGFYGNGRIRFGDGNHSKWMAVIGVRIVPQAMREDVILALLALEGEITIVQSVRPLDKTVQKALLLRQKNAAVAMSSSMNIGGEGRKQQVEDAYSCLDGSHATGVTAEIFHWQMAVMVYGATQGEVERMVDAVREQLAHAGATAVREGLVAESVFWHTLPGHTTMARPWRLLTFPIAAGWVPQRGGEGVGANDWGPEPITRYRSTQGTAFRFTFHPNEKKDALGHCVIVAPPGAGKTTMLCHVAGQTLRGVPRARIWYFDRFNGAEIWTHAMGGDYVRLDQGGGEGGKGLQLNPMLMEDTPENRNFVERWVESIAGETMEPEDRAAINQLVNLNFEHAKPERRRLDVLVRGAFRPDSKAGSAILHWAEGPGRIFCSSSDQVGGLDARWVAFDCTQALGDERIASAVVQYLIHRIQTESRKRGDPSLIVVDEAKPMLRNPEFRKRFFDVALLEGRKLHQVVISCFQEPAAIDQLGIADLVRTACPTIILLPNEQASDEDYEAFKLTRTELDFVLRRRGQRRPHGALIKRYASGHGAMIDTSLESLGGYLKCFDDNPEIVRKVRANVAEYGQEEAIARHTGVRE